MSAAFGGTPEDCGTNGVPGDCPPIFVNVAQTSNPQTGTSWETAFSSLQAGLQAARALQQAGVTAGLEIWVAAGVYLPDQGPGLTPGDTAATFDLIEGVALYGGFAGVETAREERDWNANVSVLSGDLAGNDPSPLPPFGFSGWPASADNSEHVVQAVGVGPSAVLDGFTVSGGRATELGIGGGLDVDSANPTVARCWFRNNAADFGGGVLTWDSSPHFIECTFADNGAFQGGGVWSFGGAPRFVDCAFQANTSLDDGGGMYAESGDPEFEACVFNANRATILDGFGGGLCMGGGFATLRGCTFSSNTASLDGGGMSGDGTLQDCVFVGNRGYFGGGLDGAQGAITNCTFSGNVANGPGGALLDCGGPITNCTFAFNIAKEEGAAMYACLGAISNCVMWGDVGGATQMSASSMPNYSCILSWPGGGIGNIALDPLFVSAEGLDGTPGTPDDDLRLSAASPCIDAADQSAVPADVFDVDGDGDTAEALPLDLDGKPRFVDYFVTPDTGVGPAPVVDMGAYEFFPDCDTNGVLDSSEITLGTSPDCNATGIPDGCEVAAGTSGDCNTNAVPDECDIASAFSEDCDANLIPDDCEAGLPPTAAAMTGAMILKHHGGMGPGGIALNVSGRVEDGNVTSESRAGGIVELGIAFGAPPGGPGPCPITLLEQTCPGGSQADYRPYTGAAVVSAAVIGSELVLSFAPALENARTYRIEIGPSVTTVAGQSLEVRCLRGDVSDDGRVDGTDRGIVIGVWTGSGFSAKTDLNLDGETNGTDRSLVVGVWTGGAACAP